MVAVRRNLHQNTGSKNVVKMPSKHRTSTTWTKDNPPLAKGRPKIPAEFSALMKEYSVDAAKRLLYLVDHAEDEKTQLQASIYIINRAYGAPIQATELSGPGGGPLSVPEFVVNFISVNKDKSQTIDGDGNDV